MMAAAAPPLPRSQTRGDGPRDEAVALDLGQDRSLRAEVEGFLLGAMRTGRLRPGDRVREAEIAGALGISQTPVREAILRLARDGVLVHRPRKGFVIVDLGPQEMDDVYLFRAMIEGMAARLAASRITPEQVEALEQLVEEGGAAERRGESLASVEYNAQLHALIVRAARHPLLERTWQMLAPLQWLPRDFSAAAGQPPPNRVEAWLVRHRMLVDAILSGDADRAEQAAREHVLDAGRVTLRPPAPPPPPEWSAGVPGARVAGGG